MKHKAIKLFLLMSIVGLSACSNEQHSSNPMLKQKFIEDVAHDMVAYNPDASVCIKYFQSPKDAAKNENICRSWIHKAYAEFLSRENDEAEMDGKSVPTLPTMADFEKPEVWVAVSNEVALMKKAHFVRKAG